MRDLARLAPRLPLLGVVLLCACTPVPRGGRPELPPRLPPAILDLDAAEVEKRLRFLEERLEERRDYAWYWNKGWATFYGLGIFIQAGRAAAETRNDGRQADFVVSAVKAVGGTANLILRPIGAQDGADAVRALPSATLEDRRWQLALAEEQLRLNAEEADRRWHWVRHALNVAVNAAGAIIVWQVWDARTRAWRSFGVGTAVGEAMILSAPWKPAEDWEEYQRRFDPAPAESAVRWRLLPTIGGAALHVDF